MGMERQPAEYHVQQMDGALRMGSVLPCRSLPSAVQTFGGRHADLRTVVHPADLLSSFSLPGAAGWPGVSQHDKSIHEDFVLEFAGLLCGVRRLARGFRVNRPQTVER